MPIVSRAEDIFRRILANGEAAIDEFILDRESEGQFLDFKRSADEGSEMAKLVDFDRKNLAKAVAGFGNSEGGVIVWGVDCSARRDGWDVAKSKTPIKNPTKFKSLLEGAVSGVTIPPHRSVEHAIIERKDNTGFVITLIPDSPIAPHMVVYSRRYYIRAGSDFVPAPHGVLAGMFGRTPRPSMEHSFVFHSARTLAAPPPMLEINFYSELRNCGPVMAKDLYTTLELKSLDKQSDEPRWFVSTFGDSWKSNSPSRREEYWPSVVYWSSHADFQLPPGAPAEKVLITLRITPKPVSTIEVIGWAGAKHIPPLQPRLVLSPDLILQISSRLEAFGDSDRDLAKQALEPMLGTIMELE